MIRHLCAAFLLLCSLALKSQCPRIYDYLGALTYSPQFINCNGNAYTVGFQSDVSFGSYTVSWGDGSPNHVAPLYIAGTVINHTYSAATNSYILTFTTGTCVLTGTVVNEQASLASIIVPSGVGSTLCAPKTLTFSNATTFTSTSTTYTWYFGDGSPPEVHTYTNSGQNVTHQYQKGTVNCVTQVTLMAQNYCNFTPSSNSFGPLQIYDLDDAGVTADRVIRCWPDNQFTFTNSTNRNCLPQGNTSQRYELWNFGNYWGKGTDSIRGWNPWPPATPNTISFPAIGQYSVMLLDSNMCGVDAAVINVNIVNAPVAALQVPTVNICQNSPATFTNSSSSGYQYRWNFGAGGGFSTFNGATRTFTYNTPGTYTVELVALIPGAGGACSDTARGIIQVLPSPSPAFSLSPSSGCGSLTANFTDLSTGASAWNWNFGNGSGSTLQVPPAQQYTLPSTYVATLTVTSAGGCIRSSTASLIVRNVPVPSFVQANACVGSPLNFSNTTIAGSPDPVTAYSWSLDQGTVSSSINPVHTYSLAGTYTIHLKASTAFCQDSTSQQVNIFVKPTASFAITPTVGCPPFTANFSNLSQNATTFFWRFTAAPTTTAATTGASFTYTNAGQSQLTHTVKLLAISPAGCSDSASRTVLVYAKPVADYTTNVITACSPMSTTFSNTSTGASTYSWSFGDGNTATQQNATHIYTNTTLFTQTLTATLLVTNSSGCTDTTSRLITVYPEALSAFSMVPSAGCSPLLVNFPSVPGVATYTWDHGDGSPTFTTLTQHNYNFVNNGLTDKTFTISLNATTSNGCFGSSTGTLMVYHNPVADFDLSPTAGCSPLSVNFSNTSSGSVTSAEWKFGNGLIASGNSSSSTFSNSTGGADRNYTTRLIVSTTQGCRDSAEKNVLVYAQPMALFSPDTPACSPKLITFKNRSLGAVNFRWFFGDGTSSAADSVKHLYVNNTGVPQVYQTKLIATSINLCRDSVSIPVRIYPKPEYIIEASPVRGCSPLTVFFPAIGGVAEYEWKYDNNISFGSSGNITNTFENRTAGTRVFTVQLIARNIHSCADTSLAEILVYPIPAARFSARPLSVFIPDEAVEFTNESSTLASDFKWDFGDGESSEQKNPSHRYTTPGEYEVTLIATSVHGCRDTFALAENVIALEETTIQIPNAFTPNPAGSPGTFFDPYDTSNDIFHPNVRGTERYTFSIYSRWGELLFETRNPAEGWDGYYKGKLCTPDVYIWKVNATFIDGKTYNKTGDVTLLR